MSGSINLTENAVTRIQVLSAGSDNNKHDRLTVSIREFNSYVNKDKRVENLIIPLGDGLTVCRKI